MKSFKNIILASFISAFCIHAHGEPSVTTETVTITGSVAEALAPDISAEIYRHAIYPGIALIRKWEGTVMVHITMDNKEVISSTVHSSSGNTYLDESAIKASMRMDVKRIFPAEYVGRSIEIIVPVSYRISKS